MANDPRSRRRPRVPGADATPPGRAPGSPAGRSPVPPKGVRPAAAGGKGAAARPAAPAAPDPLIGQVLGRCRIVERIGQGRTSVVYRAEHQALGTTVAVKVLLPSAAATPEILQLFATEARAIAKIDNENVIKVYDVGEEGGRHFLVMEILEGDSILDVLAREQTFEVLDALRVTRQAANGLAAAHERGIIHRDVKPQNLVLLEDGTVKLVDFGLAATDETGSKRVGTPHYMAPEVCENAQASARSDVYSLGVTLFHMLTGRPPYAGQDVKSILRSHIAGQPLRPERHNTAVKADVGDLVRLLTARDPATRPTAREVLERIDVIGGGEVTRKDTLRHRRGRARRREAARRSGTLAVTLLAAVAVAVGVFLFARGGGDAPDAPAVPKAQEPVAPRGPTPPPRVPQPPAETPEQKAERERKAEADQREKDAATAFADAERWARENWRSKADDVAVVERYRRMRDAFKGTQAALKADARLMAIKAKREHPHPDKAYSGTEAVEAALEAWRAARSDVESRIADHAYGPAKDLLPADVDDATGRAVQEMGFWRQLLGDLVRFQNAFLREVPRLPEDQRRVALADGEATITKLTDRAVDLKTSTGTKTVAWNALPDAEIARLATAALASGGADLHLARMAFAYAHRLRDAFYEAALEFDLASGTAPLQAAAKAYKDGFDARAAQAPPKGQ